MQQLSARQQQQRTANTQHSATENRRRPRTCRGGRNFDSAKQQWSEERENSFPASKVISTSPVGLFTHTHTKCFSHTKPYAIQTAPTRRPNGNFRVDVKVLNSMNLLLFTLLTIFSPLRSLFVSIFHSFFMVCTFYLKTPLHFACWWLAAGLRHETNCVWMGRKFSVAFLFNCLLISFEQRLKLNNKEKFSFYQITSIFQPLFALDHTSHAETWRGWEKVELPA